MPIDTSLDFVPINIAIITIPEYEGSKNSFHKNECKIRSSFYALHHGPDGLKQIAKKIVKYRLYFENIVAIMSIYALAGLRIIPSLNGMFSSFTSIKSSLPALSGIKTDLIQASKSKRKDEDYNFFC